MATAMPTSHYVNHIIPIIFLVENMSKDEKYRERKKIEVLAAICALLNSNGGKVEICCEETERNVVSTTILDSLTRIIQQSLKSRFGAKITESDINIENKQEKMIAIRVRKACSLVTIKYNLYRSTTTQVEAVDNVESALIITNRKCINQPVQLGSHQKIFIKNQNCRLRENEVIQFKHLKSESSKRFTLADRMIGKSNKFSCYVSAFANHRGGHIYYGIENDGIVRGEETEERSEIEKKVEKSIQKMIWPDTIDQPKRGKHWEIFFEQVLDEKSKSNPIPSTFVIVIFIAHCFGGVFTEEPESYEMVEGKVKRMSFTTWKEKLQPVGLNKWKHEVPSTIKRISLSPAAKKRCAKVSEVLTEAINNGEWEYFARFAYHFEQQYANNLEESLVVLSRRVIANYRQGNIHAASILVTEFEKRFSRAEQPLYFEVILLFLKAIVARVSGKTAESRSISIDGLAKASGLEPGLISTVPICLIAASTYDSRQKDAGLSPDILAIKAIEHLEHVQDHSVGRADLHQGAHITLATYHLGYDLSGKVIKKDIDKESFERAKASIIAVNKSVTDGNPPTGYRKVWFTLAQSILYIRYSQFQPEKEVQHLKAAFKFAKDAESLAKKSKLEEMLRWAQTTIASCTEELLLANFRRINIKPVSPQKV